MNQQLICRKLRKEFDRVGYTLLIYYGIMNAAVILVMFVQMFAEMFAIYAAGGDFLQETDAITAKVASNGWGYILAIAVGCLILLLWKKKEFCLHTIWKPNRRMTVGSFFALLSLFLSVQLLSQLLTLLMEWFFNLFGLSVMESLEAATMIGDTFSLFLYTCIFAPIFEEVLFRGLLLRMLEPRGRKFAILTTAILFGMFHGNIVQTPFAFIVGLVLGYVALEYSMAWAMVLHMINNLVLGDMLTRICEFFPVWVGDAVFLAIIGICALAAIVICIVRRREIKAYICEKKIHPWCMKSFFTSPGILIFCGLMVLNICLTLFLQLL